MKWGTLKLLHAFCRLPPIPGLKLAGTDEVIYSMRNVIMHFYLPSHRSRQILLFLHITAFFPFSCGSALSVLSGFFFSFCGSVSVFQGALLNYYCSPKDILVIYVMNFALKKNPFKYLNIVIGYHYVSKMVISIWTNAHFFKSLSGSRLFSDSVI